jgi:hypothetical protein
MSSMMGDLIMDAMILLCTLSSCTMLIITGYIVEFNVLRFYLLTMSHLQSHFYFISWVSRNRLTKTL